MEELSNISSHEINSAISPSTGPDPNAPSTASWVNLALVFALLIDVRRMVKAPSSFSPRNLSSGWNKANQRGGILQVEVRICETLSSISIAEFLIESSILWGIKNLINGWGREYLKSSSALQHLVVVDHGAIYLLPSSSKRWAPSGLVFGASLFTTLVSARFCSSQPVGEVIKRWAQLCCLECQSYQVVHRFLDLQHKGWGA